MWLFAAELSLAEARRGIPWPRRSRRQPRSMCAQARPGYPLLLSFGLGDPKHGLFGILQELIGFRHCTLRDNARLVGNLRLPPAAGLSKTAQSACYLFETTPAAKIGLTRTDPLSARSLLCGPAKARSTESQSQGRGRRRHSSPCFADPAVRSLAMILSAISAKTSEFEKQAIQLRILRRVTAICH